MTMPEDLTRHLERWREADAQGREADADAACLALFEASPRDPAVPNGFTARTIAAVTAAREGDRIRARRVRRASIAGAVGTSAAGLYLAGPWLLSGLSALVLGSIKVLVGVAVTIASGVQTGADLWTILATLGRAAAAFAAEPRVTVAMIAMQAVAMLALVALQRLLGSDRESLK